MPPIRRGRLPARASAWRGRPYGRRRRLGLRDANAPRGDDAAVQVPRAVPVPQAVPVPTVDPVPTVVPERGHDMGVQPDATPGGVEARRLENLITESIAKGVELGIAKALSAIEARPASVNPLRQNAQLQWPDCPVRRYQPSQHLPWDQRIIVFQRLWLHSPP